VVWAPPRRGTNRLGWGLSLRPPCVEGEAANRSTSLGDAIPFARNIPSFPQVRAQLQCQVSRKKGGRGSIRSPTRGA